MLKDRGVVRTGKEGADNKPLTGGAGLCGPDQHALKARTTLERMDRKREEEHAAGSPVEYNWQERDKLYADMSKLNKRRDRGEANFRPGDAC